MSEKRVRLLHLITTFSVGGAEMHLLSLVRGTPSDRFEVTVAFFKEEAREARSLVPDFQALGVEVVDLDMPHWWNLLALWRLHRLMRRGRFHAVHTHLFRADLFGPILARLAGIRIVITTIHNTERFFRNGLVRCLLVLANRSVSRVIGISEAVRHSLVREVGLPASKIDVIHYGIEVPEDTGAAAERSAVRRQLGISGDTLVIGAVGRLARQKGHAYLIQAFHSLHRVFPGVCLLIVGHDDEGLRPELERMAGPLARDAVLLPGYMDARRAMHAMDLFVLPSLWEGFGLVLLEAMSARLPIVATNVNAIPEIVVDGETGLLVPPADAGQLAATIRRLLEDPQRAQLLASGGRRRLIEKFSLETMIGKTIALYDRLIAATSN